MTPLVVRVDDRVLRLERDSVIRIGRAIEADLVLTAGSVSRQHAELRPVNGTWVLVDTGSQFGTYVEGRRITEYPIVVQTIVRCGPEATFVIAPEPVASADLRAPSHAPAPPPPPSVLLEEPTQPPTPRQPTPRQPTPGQPNAPAPPPPGPPRQEPDGLEQTVVLAAQPGGGSAQSRSGPDLLVVAEGREHRFRHPADITVGRHPEADVPISDPACSRLHGRIHATPGAWVYTNASNAGTFRGGRRMGTTQFDERLELRLGHPVAGPQLTLVPILSAAEEEQRFARQRRNRRLGIAAIVAAAVVAAVVLVVASVLGATLLVGDDGQPGREDAPQTGVDAESLDELTELELESAKAAVVKITAESYDLDDPSRTRFDYGGSGSIIRSDGLILTNAHVAAPESEGLVEQYGEDAAIADPEYVLISVTDGMTDTTSEPLYRARVVEADGYLDVAVIQIYANADGSALEGELDLPTVEIGDSADLRSGDDISVLGFPGVALSEDTVTVTRGVIATLVHDPGLGEVAEFDTDARISPGNSGGMAIDNDARLIGVPTATFADSGVTSGRIRAVDVVKDVIESAEAATD